MVILALATYNHCCTPVQPLKPSPTLPDASFVVDVVDVANDDMFVIDIGKDNDKGDGMFVIPVDFIETDAVSVNSSSSSEYFADDNQATVTTVDAFLL